MGVTNTGAGCGLTGGSPSRGRPCHQNPERGVIESVNHKPNPAVAVTLQYGGRGRGS
jgi:hypothetical protein